MITHRAPGRTVKAAGFILFLLAGIAGGTAHTARGEDTTLQPPRIAVLQSSPQVAPGLIFVAPKLKSGSTTTGPQGPEIVDDQGRPLWFDPITNGDQPFDFRVQRYRGKPVLTWWQGQSHIARGVGEGVDEIMDSSYHVIATLHAANGLDADQHEFVLTPRGTALITVYHAVPYDLSSVGGPVNGKVFDGIVQEIDVATGRVLFEWHSLDHVPLTDSYLPPPVSPATPWDYFHMNSINLTNDQNLLISARHTSTVYKVDRHTGDVIWRLGGQSSDFSLGPGAQFLFQHDAEQVGPDTLRIFDNESAGVPVLPHSRVIWIHLDMKTMTATLERSIEHPAGLSVPSQGNAQGLDNGDTFVGWGATGRLSEFDSENNLLFDAAVPTGYDTYRAYRTDWIGRPDSDPIATAQVNGDGTTTVHAIWNGATEVAQWRVLAGTDAGSLTPATTVPWNGFDTSVAVDGTPAMVEVEALDEHGHVIANSEPTGT